MNRTRRGFVLSFAGLLGAMLAACSLSRPADLVVIHGKILTVDDRFNTAEAAAIRDGVFVFVGSNEQAQEWIGKKTRVLDAGGRTVIPGLIETHVHPLNAAREELVLPFRQLGSIAEIQNWIRQTTKTTPPGRWIKVPRCYPTRIHERRYPTRAELDAASDTGHPVVFDGAFAYVLNTAALRAAGIARDTVAPPGHEIVKDAGGDPTGLLRDAVGAVEQSALIGKYLPIQEVSEEATLDMLERLHLAYSRTGITSINERWEQMDRFRRHYGKLREQGRLHVRAMLTTAFTPAETAEGTREAIAALPAKFGDGDDWIRIGALKIIVDGGILLGTAYLREPYGAEAAGLYGITCPEHRGRLGVTAEQIKDFIREAHRQGWQAATHVTGDGGADLVLDAVEAADRDRPVKDRRFTLIHAYFPSPDAARRAARLGVCVDTQSAWYYQDADAIATVLDEGRMARFIGLQEWMHGGVKLAINSDHMSGIDPSTASNPFNPFFTMWVAVARKTRGGRVIGPGQRVSRQDALRMMTMNAAYLDFEEGKKGSIEVGKLGDLAVLSEDFMACDEDGIKDIKVRVTVLGGKVVYGPNPDASR